MTVRSQVRACYPWLAVLVAGSLIGALVALAPLAAAYLGGGLLAVAGVALVTGLLLWAPEVLFGLYMAVGSFKTALQPLQNAVGLDLTVLLGLLVIVGILANLRPGVGGAPRMRIYLHWPILSAYLLLAAWMAASLLWSPGYAQGAGLDKAGRFATLTLLAFAAPFFLIDRWARLERFLWTLFLAGLVFTSRALVGIYLAGELSQLVRVLGADHLIVGQVCGITALLGVAFLIGPGTGWWLRLFLLASTAAAIVVVFLSGARGPALAWPMALAAPLFLGKKWGKRSWLVLIAGLVGLAILVAFWSSGLLPPEVISRFELAYAALILREPFAMASFGRIYLWQDSFQAFAQHPLLGLGVGAYRAFLGPYLLSYSHNLWLEAGAELGLVGLVLAGFMTAMPPLRWHQCSRLRTTAHHRNLFDMALLVYIFYLVGVTKSGDFNTNRTFWMGIGLVMAACILAIRESRAWKREKLISGEGEPGVGAAGDAPPEPRYSVSAPPMAELKEIHVCMLTSVHPPFDGRIFCRESQSLVRAGYRVTLIAPADFPRQQRDGVTVLGVSPPRRVSGRTGGGAQAGRLQRPWLWWQLWRQVRRLQPEVVHFHDPELLLLVPLLRAIPRRRPKIVYDVHEYFVDSLFEKQWIAAWLRPAVAAAARALEQVLMRGVDGVVCAVEGQKALYPAFRGQMAVVRNLPRIAAFAGASDSSVLQVKGYKAIYVGIVTRERGMEVLLEALRLLRVRGMEDLHLFLVGPHAPEGYVRHLQALAERNQIGGQVHFPGWVDHDQLKHFLTNADIALAPGLPTRQFSRPALATKLFEYMLCRLPVVSSDLPYHQHYIQECQCGLIAPGHDAAAFAQAIAWLRDHPDEARAMGERGRAYVLEHYTWEQEQYRLLEFYESLLGSARGAPSGAKEAPR